MKTKLGTQDVSKFTVDNIIQCLKDNGFGEPLEELGQEALDNYFDMRQGKAESILDHIFRGEILTVALKKDTATDLDEKIRGYWLMRTSNLTEREVSGIKIITREQTQLAQVNKAITQTIGADELKKVTPCNRCGAIGHGEEECTQPARSRKKRSLRKKENGKSRRFRRGKSHGKGGGSSNYTIVEVYNDGSKTQTHMKVPLGYAVLDCGAAKSLCGAKPVAQMAQTCAREGKRVGDERDTEAIDESYHFGGIGN